MIKISVVIPVYNAKAFLVKAVESALSQSEVAEIILVEDKSPDNCLALCRSLEEQHDRVKVFQHPNGENRGAAASRNLGLLQASSPFIGFLDADDYYLPGRFAKAGEILANDPSIDGVYDAVGLHIYSQRGRERYEQYKGKPMASDKLISVHKPVEPEELFESLIVDNNGIFHANGITVKRDLIFKCGMFDEDLNIVEDVVLWLKLAYHGRLVAGSLIEPVARQGIHDENREPETKPILLYHKYRALFNYFRNEKVKSKILHLLFIRMMAYHPNRKIRKSRLANKAELLRCVTFELFKNPRLISKLYLKSVYG